MRCEKNIACLKGAVFTASFSSQNFCILIFKILDILKLNTYN